MTNDAINFPSPYDPSRSAIHVRNEIHIEASPERIWFWLTHAATWPDWYDDASNVELEDGDTHLSPTVNFKWRTFNTNISSEVKEFQPYQRLAWIARGTGLLAYHAWLIVPDHQGCKVITEETQQGWLPSLAKWFIRKGLLKQHQRWLEGLKSKAETPNHHISGLDEHILSV
ncbi:MAG: SRPBCC domain-containing protein [Bacteroidota bacterium]